MRDAILRFTAEEASSCRDKQQAERYMNAHLAELEACANEVLAENGFPYTAKAVLGRFDFPDKTYGEVTYPAGQYDALRLVLGGGRRAKLVVRHVPAAVHRKRRDFSSRGRGGVYFSHLGMAAIPVRQQVKGGNA